MSAARTGPTQVLMIGASPLIRAGVTQLLDAYADRIVVVGATRGLRPVRVDLVLVDLDDGPVAGESALGMLATYVRSGLPVVALSWREDAAWVRAVLAIGPAGLLFKGVAGSELASRLLGHHAEALSEARRPRARSCRAARRG